MTFIRKVKGQKFGKPNNLKVFPARKPKDLNMISKLLETQD